MRKNDYNVSSDGLLDMSNPDEAQLDSASFESSDRGERAPTAHFSAPPDLQHTIFLELQEVSRQHLEVGQIDQALQGYERCTEKLVTILRGNTESQVFQNYLHSTIHYLNDMSLRFLRANNIRGAIKILNKCLELGQPENYQTHPDLNCLTYNHLGCCYRRLQDLDQALNCLERALDYQEMAREMGSQGKYMESSSITHVNLCAVLSQKGYHDQALEHAQKAVAGCTQDYLRVIKNQHTAQQLEEIKKKATMLAIAYFNLGVEEDFCRDTNSAVEDYFKAFKIAEKHNGPGDQVTMRFEQAYNEAKMKQRSKSPPKKNSPQRINSAGTRQKVGRNIMLRPQSAHQFQKQEPQPTQFNQIKVERGLSPKIYGKRPAVKTLGGFEHDVSSPTTPIQTISLPKTTKTQIFLSRKPFFNKPKKTTKTITTSMSTKLFFPMGNMRPLVEPEEPKKVQKPQRPQRPATANPISKAQHEHRANKPSTPSARWEVRPLFPGRSQMAQQEEIQEDEEMMQGNFNSASEKNKLMYKFKEFMNPNASSKSMRNLGNRGNESTKWTSSLASEQTTDAYYSLRKGNKSAGLLVGSLENEIYKEDQRHHLRGRKGEYMSAKKAATTIQRYVRGWQTREMTMGMRLKGNNKVFWTGLSEIINQDLENKGKPREYYILMIYESTEEIIYVEMKDLETGALYKGRIEHTIEREDLKQVCWKLRETIALEDGKISFKDKNDEKLRELMTEISEKSDESDVGPLIEALEKEERQEFLYGNEPLEEIEEISEDINGEKAKEASKAIEEDVEVSNIIKSFGEAATSDKKGSITKGESESKIKEISSIREISDKKSNNSRETLSQSKKKIEGSNQEIEGSTMKSTNKTLVFSRQTIVKGQIATITLESCQGSKDEIVKYIVSCSNPRSSEEVKTIEIPSNLLPKKTLNLEDLLELLVIDFDPFRVTLNISPKPHDSFSSYNEASIALDLSGSRVENRPGMFRSESFKKQAFHVEQLKVQRGFSYGTIDYNAIPEQGQYLGLNQFAKPPRLQHDQSENLLLSLKISEGSSRRDLLSGERPDTGGRRGLKDSRTTVSQGEISNSNRSEVEGSLMLRVTEGIISYCKVTYKNGESEVSVKYKINQDDGEFSEVKISLEEFGLESGELVKDMLLEKVRGLLGKRLKYRQGQLVYDKRMLTRENTAKDEEKKSTGMTMTKIDEVVEEWDKKHKKGEDSKTRTLTTPKESTGDREVRVAKSNGDLDKKKELLLLVKQNSIDSQMKKPKSYGEVKSLAKVEQEEIGSTKLSRENSNSKANNVKDDESVGLSPPNMLKKSSRQKSLGGTSDDSEKVFVETFGALQSSDDSNTIDRGAKKVEAAETTFRILKKKSTFEQDANGKRVVPAPKIPEIKNVITNAEKSLSVPELKKAEDSSPKVRPTPNGENIVEVSEKKEDSAPNSVWSSISIPEDLAKLHEEDPDGEKRKDGRRKTLKRSHRSYAGDIPRIVIHRDKEGPTMVMDFNYFAKTLSLGTLGEGVPPEPRKESARRMSRSNTDKGHMAWEEEPKIQRTDKHKVTARFGDADANKEHNLKKRAKEEAANINKVGLEMSEHFKMLEARHKKAKNEK